MLVVQEGYLHRSSTSLTPDTIVPNLEGPLSLVPTSDYSSLLPP